jgi:hypothetical protein
LGFLSDGGAQVDGPGFYGEIKLIQEIAINDPNPESSRSGPSKK